MNEERVGHLTDDQIMQLTVAMRYYDRQQEAEIVDTLTVQGLKNMEIFYQQLSERINAHRQERVQKLFGTPEGLEYAAQAREREQQYQKFREEFVRVFGEAAVIPDYIIDFDNFDPEEEGFVDEEEEEDRAILEGTAKAGDVGPITVTHEGDGTITISAKTTPRK